MDIFARESNCLFVFPVGNNDVGEAGDDDPSDSECQCEQKSSDEKVFGDEDIAEKMEGCEGENTCQIHGKTDLQQGCFC